MLKQWHKHDTSDVDAAIGAAIGIMEMQRRLTIEEIADAVCDVTGVAIDVMQAVSKTRRHADARWMVSWLAYEYTDMTKSEIAEWLGGKRHATVVHGIRNAKEWLDKPMLNRRWVEELDEVKNRLMKGGGN